ncbi:hypothetical protein AVEN_216680-1 [Araneus ventricosus]|uniref:Uncharacterized protein n=1 Tax=Araneus ventricosus TaxID=182803 RepID=A0A4Y2DWS5_ARAVE|nr:hypothetical protein AVEN_216680-1 [Araneus ventricosus]
MDLVILNSGQMTRTAPELTPPLTLVGTPWWGGCLPAGPLQALHPSCVGWPSVEAAHLLSQRLALDERAHDINQMRFMNNADSKTVAFSARTLDNTQKERVGGAGEC